MLNSAPASRCASTMSSRSSRSICLLCAASSAPSISTPRYSMRASTGTSGCSISCVQPLQRRHAVQLRRQHLVQLQGHVGILGRVLRSALHRHLIEGQLLGALAGHLLERDGLDAQILRRRRVHVVARGHAVPDVGLEHGVVAHALDVDVVVGQHVGIVLQMLAELGQLRILQQRLQRREHPRARQLFGRAGIVVRERHIGGDTGLDAERDADDLGIHVVQARGLGVEGEQRRAAQAREPAFKLLPAHDGFVVRAGGLAARHRPSTGAATTVPQRAGRRGGPPAGLPSAAPPVSWRRNARSS